MTKIFTGTGDFSNALDWSGGTIPGSSDSFEIAEAATVSASATAANGAIDANGTLDIAASGVLDLGGRGLSNAGTLIIAGTLANATLSGTGPLYQGGTLDNVTATVIDLSAGSATVNLTGSLTLGSSSVPGATSLTGAGSRLTILDNETFANNIIGIGSTTGVSALIADQTLSINGNSNIEQSLNNSASEIGGAGTINASSIAVLGTQDTMLIDVANFDMGSGSRFGDQTSGSSVTISSSSFTNNGTINVGLFLTHEPVI